MKLTKSKLKQIIKEELISLPEGWVQDMLKKFRRPKATGRDKAMPKEKDEDRTRIALRKFHRQKAVSYDMGQLLSSGDCAAIEKRIKDLETDPEHVLNQPESDPLQKKEELSKLRDTLSDCIKMPKKESILHET